MKLFFVNMFTDITRFGGSTVSSPGSAHSTSEPIFRWKFRTPHLRTDFAVPNCSEVRTFGLGSEQPRTGTYQLLHTKLNEWGGRSFDTYAVIYTDAPSQVQKL